MKKWELLHIFNSRSYKGRTKRLLGSNKKMFKTRRVQVEGSLISEMSSEFVWISVF